MKDDAIKTEVLEFCNSVREGYGAPGLEELEPGTMGDPLCCPVSRTIKKDTQLCVVANAVSINVKVPDPDGACHTRMTTPRMVGAFISMYDAGWFPELVG